MKKRGNIVPRVSKRLSFGAVQVSYLALVVSMLVMVSDVVATRGFNRPVPAATELTEALLVVIIFGALAYVETQGQHIRMMLIFRRLTPQARSALDLLARVALLIFFGLALWKFGQWAWQSILIKEYAMGIIEFPIYPIKIVLVVFTAILVIQVIVDTVHNIGKLTRREGK